MKHDDTTTAIRRCLEQALAASGVRLETDRLAALVEYTEWTADSAQKLGLTQYRSPEEFASGLICPTLGLLSAPLDRFLRSPVVDFGAGSGAMGLSLAFCRPDLEIVLADRRKRVVDFIDVCRARFGLEHCRTLLVDLSRAPASETALGSLVLLRAYGPAKEALAQSARWVSPPGHIALWHQPGTVDLPSSLESVVSLPTSLAALSLTLYRRK